MMRLGRLRLGFVLSLAFAAWVVLAVSGAIYQTATSPIHEEMAAQARESEAKYEARMAVIRRDMDKIRSDMDRINPGWDDG